MMRRGRRCRSPRCKQEGRLVGLGFRDFCPDHARERDARAASEWISPTLLRRVPYDGNDPTPRACFGCGHPRWAHEIPGVFWDGPCLVLGCDGCDGRGDHEPGYVPGVAA